MCKSPQWKAPEEPPTFTFMSEVWDFSRNLHTLCLPEKPVLLDTHLAEYRKKNLACLWKRMLYLCFWDIWVWKILLMRGWIDFMISLHILQEKNIVISWINGKPPTKTTWHIILVECFPLECLTWLLHLSKEEFIGIWTMFLFFTNSSVTSVLSNLITNWSCRLLVYNKVTTGHICNCLIAWSLFWPC